MEGLIQEKGTVRLRRIDIDRWDSPVAEQFGIRRLPTLWLYEGTERIEDDAREIWKILQGE